MLIVAVLVTGSAFLTLRSLNAAAMKADRYRITQEALNKAKEALIAYAVSDPNRPGSLPCPDVNDDGRSLPANEYTGSNCTSLIGRIPWITLGLPDLRDASGERLWYALSHDFRANGTIALNSDTAFRTAPAHTSLTIGGTQPASNVVAIVFSPGSALRRTTGVTQTRPCAAGVCNSNAVNYLDVSGVDNADGDTIFVSAAESETFNDRLLPILSDDIMALVEKRAGREWAQYLRDHFDNWNTAAVTNTKGFYPWAATFNDPSVLSPGVSGTNTGLLPLSVASLTWSNVAATVGTCTGNGTSQMDCTAVVLCIPPFLIVTCALGISGRVNNLGTAFVDPPDNALITTTGVSIGAPAGTWTLVPGNQRLDFSLNAASFIAIGVVNISVRAPVASSWTAASWLTTNNWHQVSYYSLSPGYALNGTNTCTAGTTCVTVGNTAGTTNNKQAVVVTTGRPLPLLTAPGAQASPRPSGVASLNNYLEGVNQAPDLVFQAGMRTTQFNDQPTIVRP